MFFYIICVEKKHFLYNTIMTLFAVTHCGPVLYLSVYKKDSISNCIFTKGQSPCADVWPNTRKDDIRNRLPQYRRIMFGNSCAFETI